MLLTWRSALVAALAALSACSSQAPTASRTPAVVTPVGSPTLAIPTTTTTPLPASSTAPPTSATSTANPTTVPTQPAAAPPPHLLVIVLENTEYSSVIGNPAAAPYLNGLAGRYGLATRYFASAHPSLPNYLELIAGSTFGLDGSDCATCMVQGSTLTDELTAHGVGWTAYMDGLPSPCFNGPAGPGAHPYARKHDPFLYFPQNLSGPCHVVPLSRMGADLAAGRASPFLWISPDLCNDGHDAGCGLPAADSWMARTLPGIMASTWYRQGGTVLVVWDEGASQLGCCAGAYGGHVAAIAVSQRVAPGTRLASAVDHAGALRGIEELYGVGLLGASANPASGDLLPLLRG